MVVTGGTAIMRSDDMMWAQDGTVMHTQAGEKMESMTMEAYLESWRCEECGECHEVCRCGDILSPE